jgi:hypothetical protein
MITTDFSPTTAAFLLYMSRGETPKNALDLALVDTINEKFLERNYDKVFMMKKHTVFAFLHPEVPDRIKSAARILQTWYLNFEQLKPGELDQINAYIDGMNKYFAE